MRAALFATFIALISVGGGCSDEILAADFDQTCTADADCVTILVGKVCDCSCMSAAINKRDLAEYNERQDAISCSNDCGPCPALDAAVCKSGACSVE